jgi:site-specific recombinase XerD
MQSEVTRVETPPRRLSDALEWAKLHGRIEGRSPRTLEAYEAAFRSLMAHIGDVPLDELRPGDLRRWMAALLDAGYAKASVSLWLRSVRAVLSRLHREGLLRENPALSVQPPKTPQHYPRVLSESEVLALLKAARAQAQTWHGKRNWAMLLTLLDAMLRLKELIDLELQDVNLQARSIRVRHGKGDKERVVFMGRRLTKAMRDWLSVRGHVLGSDWVFISRSGERLDKRNVQRILERLGKRAGGVKVSPHMLRHTGATLFIRNGGDPFSLQRLLGHSDIQTTMVYVHMAGSALREAHAKASPVDRLLS